MLVMFALVIRKAAVRRPRDRRTSATRLDLYASLATRRTHHARSAQAARAIRINAGSRKTGASTRPVVFVTSEVNSGTVRTNPEAISAARSE